MSKEEILIIEINDIPNHVDSYEAAQQLIEEETGKEIAMDLVFDIFDNDKYYYI